MLKKIYNIKYLLSLFFIVILFSNYSFASNYLKVNYGLTSSSVGASSTKGTIVTDEEDEGFIVSAGSLIGEVWGLDFIYYDLGSTSIKVDATESFTFEGNNYIASSAGTISNDISGYGGGLFISSSNDGEFLSVSGTLRLGLHSWDKTGSTSILDNSTGFSGAFYNKGIGAYAGLGISINLTSNLAADLSIDTIGLNNIVSFDDSSTIGALGLKYNF